MIELLAVCIGAGVALEIAGRWWSNRNQRRAMDFLRAAALDQSRRLTVVSTELHYARAEVARVTCEVVAVRVELTSFVHGPPSMKRPPMAAR